MSSTKRINGEYLITNKEALTANVTVSTHTLYVDGNLIVGGTSSSVTKTDTEITDNTITLNKGETGPGVTLGYSGIEVDRGTGQYVPAVRWNEAGQYWELTNDGSTYTQIVTGSGGAGLSAVIDDPAPELGGNLNITSHTLYDTAANVTIFAGTPAVVDEVFTNTETTTNQELVTKTKAIVYALIM